MESDLDQYMDIGHDHWTMQIGVNFELNSLKTHEHKKLQ